MELREDNVVELNNINVVIYDHIETFLGLKESKNTVRNYRMHINHFFKLIKKKDIKFLSIDDLQITKTDFDKFIVKLKKKEFLGSTINNKVTPIKELLRYLYEVKIDGERLVKDIGYLSLKLIKRQKENKKSYGVLTHEEVNTMANLALSEREKAKMKYYFIKFAYDTGYRIDEILNLKFTDFKEGKNDAIYIDNIGKGNISYKRMITKEFYNGLVSLKEKHSNKVFNINVKSIEATINRLKKQMEISDERNITFHSIRKAAGTFAFISSGNNIMVARKFLNHKNITTTQGYLGIGDDYGVFGAVSSEMRTEKDLYKTVSHEDLLNVIDQLSDSDKLFLNIKLQKGF